MIRALLLVAVTLLPSLSWAAEKRPVFGSSGDGILPGVEFRIPFAVDGVPTKKGGKATVTLGADGKGVLRVGYAKDGDVEGVAYTLIRTDSPDPVPPAPIPPAPDPVPPLPYVGLHVLIVEEKTDREKITAGQRDIILSTGPGTVNEYLKKTCAKGPGNAPQFRIVDKDVKFADSDTVWKTARQKFSDLKVTVPGWIVSNGVGFEFGPLPVTQADALGVLKKLTPPGSK